MVVQVCVGSACHLRGSEEIVELLQRAIQENGLENEVALAGTFCIGKCIGCGVTVQIDGVVHAGVTRENFKEFFHLQILSQIERE